MRLKDGDFICTADSEAEAQGIVNRCNKLIAHEQLSDELEAYYVVMRLNKGQNRNAGYISKTYAILLRKRERAECEQSQ